MNRSWLVALFVSVVVHVGIYLGPWSLSRPARVDTDPVMVRIELPPPEPPPEEPPPPQEPPPPEEPPPPDEPPTPDEPAEPPPPKRSRPPTPPEPSPPVTSPDPTPVDPTPSPIPVPKGPGAPVPAPSPQAPTAKVPPTIKPPPPAPQPKPAPRPGLSKADFVAYAKGMRRRMLAHRRYPPAALRNELEGVVKVKVSVDRKGRVVGTPTIARSCGHSILDAEALRMVKVAAPFAPLPGNAAKDVMVFVIPIDFTIRRQ